MNKLKLFAQALFSWSIDDLLPVDEHCIFDAYFCLSFGNRISETSETNQFLVNSVIKKYKQTKKPLIIQSECAHAFPLSIYIDKVISSQDMEVDHQDTYEAVQRCYVYCKENKIKSLLVFAHPQHAWRVKRSLEKIGLHPFIANTKGAPYDLKSTQAWAKSEFIFIPRELFKRLYYLFSGKI